MRSWLFRVLCVAAVAGAATVIAPAAASADAAPTVSSLSVHSGPYWGATRVIVRGAGLDGAQRVLFGSHQAWGLRVLSSTALEVYAPEHGYGTVHVRVVTSAATSPRADADRFTFTRPTLDTPIMGGLTARQEQRISAHVRAAHRAPRIAYRSTRWTAAMGRTAARRARSWLGLPYSWAGGLGSGPSTGVCAHNGGDLDCHVVGFDCSGLSLNAWSPYRTLAHYAATQHARAGRFHPTVGELMPGDLVFFSGYIADGIGHVAVYVGHGMVVQAAQSGTLVMRSRLVDVIAESGRYRGATRPTSTGVQGSGPRVTSVTDRLPSTGGDITIRGSGLDEVNAVSVGGTMRYSFVRRTATSLVVKAPAHQAGTASVVVSNAWGYVRRSLTYVGPPQLTSLSPSTGPVSGGTTVTVSGASLSGVRQVSVDGAAVPFHVVSDRQLTITTPLHAPGDVQVVATSPLGASNALTFTFAPTSSSSPTPHTAARPADRTAPRPPATTNARFFQDRVGEQWYLLGRRVATHGEGPPRSTPS